MENQSANGILEDFRIEFLDCWHRMPNKGFFLVLLVAWLALFQFLGNSTLGYIPTPSLLKWMHEAYMPNHDPGANDDSYGRWIPFIVLGLFWWKRKQLMALPMRAWWPGLLLLGLGLVMHLLGYMIQQPKISIMALFLGVYALMGLAWGPEWLRESFFPTFLFAFCVPLGWTGVSLTFPLRMIVIRVVEFICGNFLAIDVVREGTKLMDPSGTWGYEVAAACSGIRSLIATSAVAVIYAMVSFRTWWKRGLLIASALPLAIFGNVVRMLAIVIAAEIWGQDAGKAVDEGGPGGVFALLPYIPAFGGLLLLGRLLEGKASKRASPAITPAAEASQVAEGTECAAPGEAQATRNEFERSKAEFQPILAIAGDLIDKYGQCFSFECSAKSRVAHFSRVETKLQVRPLEKQMLLVTYLDSSGQELSKRCKPADASVLVESVLFPELPGLVQGPTAQTPTRKP